MPGVPLGAQSRLRFREAQKIMRLVLVLWAVRGCFTHEILYSPGFCMAIGLALGLQLTAVPKIAEAVAPGARHVAGRRVY